MITIKDIAKEANVSEGTIDRVLHNRGGVSKKTKENIKKILNKHNFSVNPVASALAKKNKFQIATLIPEHNTTDLFWKSPLLGILKASKEVKNFGVQITNHTFNQYNPKSYLKTFQTLLKTKPSAVIIVPIFLKETKLIVKQLEKLDIPYTFLNIEIEGFKNFAFVGQDSYTAGYIAGKLMHLSLPKQSVFLIIQSKHNFTENNAITKRIEGFNGYFIKNKIREETLTLKVDNLNNLTESAQIINTFLKQHKAVKGVFVPSSRISIITNSIENNYLKTLRMIGFDNTPQNIDCLKNDSVSFLISQKPFDQGYESIKLATDFLLKKKIPKNKVYLPIDILTKENVAYNERNEFVFKNENYNV